MKSGNLLHKRGLDDSQSHTTVTHFGTRLLKILTKPLILAEDQQHLRASNQGLSTGYTFSCSRKLAIFRFNPSDNGFVVEIWQPVGVVCPSNLYVVAT